MKKYILVVLFFTGVVLKQVEQKDLESRLTTTHSPVVFVDTSVATKTAEEWSPISEVQVNSENSSENTSSVVGFKLDPGATLWLPRELRDYEPLIAESLQAEGFINSRQPRDNMLSPERIIESPQQSQITVEELLLMVTGDPEHMTISVPLTGNVDSQVEILQPMNTGMLCTVGDVRVCLQEMVQQGLSDKAVAVGQNGFTEKASEELFFDRTQTGRVIRKTYQEHFQREDESLSEVNSDRLRRELGERYPSYEVWRKSPDFPPYLVARFGQ